MENLVDGMNGLWLGAALAFLNFFIGVRIKHRSIGKSLDHFFVLGVGFNAVRAVVLFILVCLFLRTARSQALPFLMSLAVTYFILLIFEIRILSHSHS